MNRKILITGGDGFIARSLFYSLTDWTSSPLDQEVLAPNRQELDLMDSSLVKNYLEEHKFDVVIHAATYDAAPRFSTKDPMAVLENNLRMFFNVAHCKDSFGKMICFGSGAEAGRENWIPKMSEEYIGSNVPPDQYGYSKYIMNRYAQCSDNIYNIRLFSVFGEGDDWRYRTVSNLCCKKMLGKELILPKDQKRDFLYIKDLISLVELFMEIDSEFHDYNACSGRPLSDSDVARKLDEDFVYTGEVLPEYTGSNKRLLCEFPYLKFTPFDVALNNMIKYYTKEKCSVDEGLLEY